MILGIFSRAIMPITLSSLEKLYRELSATVAPKALNKVAADNEGTQILKAANGLELDGDGKATRCRLIQKINALLGAMASRGMLNRVE